MKSRMGRIGVAVNAYRRHPFNPEKRKTFRTLHGYYFSASGDEWLAGPAFFAKYRFPAESTADLLGIKQSVFDLGRLAPAIVASDGEPDVSVIIPVYGQTHYVLSCLDSLARQRSKYNAEILVFDDASPAPSETSELADIGWIRYHRSEQNNGFLRACNAAAGMARGRYIILLNSDTRVLENWLDELLDSFSHFPNAGLVGSKLYNDDGSLQEAGGIVWRDGSAWNYGRWHDPEEPRFCFARQVDYVSAASIAVRREVWEQLGGFDEAFVPAYAEDTDFAFRVRKAGYETWLQPLSRVIHYEGKTHGTDTSSGVKAYQVANLKKLKTRWRRVLAKHGESGVRPDWEANRTLRKRMLVVDAVTPTPNRDSGSFMTDKMIAVYQQLGYQITFVPQHNYADMPVYTSRLQRRGIECMYAPYARSIRDVLDLRGPFDIALIYRHNVATQVLDDLRELSPHTPVIFHNVDLHYLREMREAELSGSDSAMRQAQETKEAELGVIKMADCLIVHTDVERDIIAREIGSKKNVVVFPYMAETCRSATGFADRRDILFVGGFAHPPNVDGILFFLSGIWPKIAARMPDARLVIVGPDAPPSVYAHAGPRVVVTGHVPELAPYFDSARVFVAPLRYGAGIKGKVIQALAHGVPTVGTMISAEGIGGPSDGHILVADEEQAFADHVVSLWFDESLWQGVRSVGYRFVESNLSWNCGVALCKKALDIASRKKAGEAGPEAR